MTDESVRKSDLTLLTAGTWSLQDAANFVQAIERVYGLFVTLHLATDRVHARSSGAWGSPSLTEYVLSASIREPPDGEGWAPQFSPHPLRTMPLDLPFGPEVKYLQFLFDHRYTLAPTAVPTIGSWVMSSPGRVKICGLGHVIREVREFIKDLKFRNRQEEELGALEIARRKMELDRNVLSPPALDFMATQLLTEFKPIATLEDNGKLLSPASFEALHDTLVQRLTALAKRYPTLKPLIRRVAGLSDRSSPTWDRRAIRVEAEISTLYDQDILSLPDHSELRGILRELKRIRRPPS